MGTYPVITFIRLFTFLHWAFYVFPKETIARWRDWQRI